MKYEVTVTSRVGEMEHQVSGSVDGEPVVTGEQIQQLIDAIRSTFDIVDEKTRKE